jgi:hypothetical protein
LQKIEKEIQNQESLMTNADLGQLDVNAAIDFAFALIKSLPTNWEAFDVVDFKALRSILFPDNVYYLYPGFQTPTLTFIYNTNCANNTEKVSLAAPRGIEPRLPG